MRVTLYLHTDKETNYAVGEKVGLTPEQLKRFIYTGYEHEAVYEVAEDGFATLISIDGRALANV